MKTKNRESVQAIFYDIGYFEILVCKILGVDWIAILFD